MNGYQQAVVEAFKHAWSAYRKYSWGKDTLQPLSKSYETWFDLGLTLIDSLDTMYIMGLKDGQSKIYIIFYFVHRCYISRLTSYYFSE